MQVWGGWGGAEIKANGELPRQPTATLQANIHPRRPGEALATVSEADAKRQHHAQQNRGPGRARPRRDRADDLTARARSDLLRAPA